MPSICISKSQTPCSHQYWLVMHHSAQKVHLILPALSETINSWAPIPRHGINFPLSPFGRLTLQKRKHPNINQHINSSRSSTPEHQFYYMVSIHHWARMAPNLQKRKNSNINPTQILHTFSHFPQAVLGDTYRSKWFRMSRNSFNLSAREVPALFGSIKSSWVPIPRHGICFPLSAPNLTEKKALQDQFKQNPFMRSSMFL